MLQNCFRTLDSESMETQHTNSNISNFSRHKRKGVRANKKEQVLICYNFDGNDNLSRLHNDEKLLSLKKKSKKSKKWWN